MTISHWLGHASIETTNRYAAVDLETKRAAVAKARPLGEIDPALAAWRTDATILSVARGPLSPKPGPQLCGARSNRAGVSRTLRRARFT